jgi:hypothetical protein
LVKNYVAYLIAISVLVGIVPGFSIASAQYVPFKVPFLSGGMMEAMGILHGSG